MKKLIDWVDDRTGIRKVIHEALYENIPSGARLRYVTGSMLVFAFATQMITGIVLWMAYSPSSQTAWESVYFIQYEMSGGWFLRGIHHFMAQAMIVLLGMHLLQVIIDKAYKGPREVNFWLGLILMQLVLGLALTGYLLPWDQKGYWATNVATNLMALVPFGVGEKLQQLVIGGTDYNHHTLTRFFGMHAGVLPILLIVFLGLHIAVFRRHGITAKITPGRADQYFFPYQVLLDGIGCLVLVIVVVALVMRNHGAELGAPADPSEPYGAARPEWYFLFLFQFLKLFHGSWEIVGAIIIPGAVVTFMFFMPFVGKIKGGHAFNVGFIFVLLAGAGALTYLALTEDSQNAVFQADKHEAHENAERIVELVQRRKLTETGELSEPLMIPRQGAVYLLRNDPLTEGPKLFGLHCASCHSYVDPEGKDQLQFKLYQEPVVANPTAKHAEDKEVKRDGSKKVVYQPLGLTGSNLYGFASREWIRGLLDPEKIDYVQIAEPEPSKDPLLAKKGEHPSNHRKRIIAPYFGNTAHRDGRMAEWVKNHWLNDMESEEKSSENLSQQEIAEQKKKKAAAEEKKAKAEENIEAIVVALSAQAQLPSQQHLDDADVAKIAKGVELIKTTCATHCHQFGDAGQLGLGPDLTGYGSYEWMMGMLCNASHERFYRNENDRMPAFAEDPHNPKDHQVSIRELSLIVDWMRGQYYGKDDNIPRLPHSEEEARQTAMASIPSGDQPASRIIGRPVPSDAQLIQEKAEQLFTRNCSACHSHADEDGVGIVANQPKAPNLFQFGSRRWLTGFLDPERIKSIHYFGNTIHQEGEMVGVVEEFEELDEEQQELLNGVIVALSAQAQLPIQKMEDDAAREDGSLEKANEAFGKSIESYACSDCHVFPEYADGDDGPNLIGWGSRDWLKKMISDPEHFYGKSNDKMPKFRADESTGKKSLLSEDELELLIGLIRGELE